MSELDQFKQHFSIIRKKWRLVNSKAVGLQCFKELSKKQQELIKEATDEPVAEDFIAERFACKVGYILVLPHGEKKYRGYMGLGLEENERDLINIVKFSHQLHLSEAKLHFNDITLNRNNYASDK